MNARTTRTIRSVIGAGCFIVMLRVPDGASSLVGPAVDPPDKGDTPISRPWFSNTFVKLRAEGTHAVELTRRSHAKRRPAESQIALSKVQRAEILPPEPVQNLRRADQ